jgi:hypothetical protein
MITNTRMMTNPAWKLINLVLLLPDVSYYAPVGGGRSAGAVRFAQGLKSSFVRIGFDRLR